MQVRLGTTVAMTLALALAGVSSASAATEVGNDCVANGYSSDFTLLQLGKSASSSLPIATPSSGVVTRWKVNSGLTAVLAENLRVFRATGNPNELKTIAESASEPIFPGANVFETRIPVLAGDRFGTHAASPSGALYCSPTSSSDGMGAVHYDAAVGTTQTYTPNPGFQVAISAIVEPDGDGDGYGDETQDGCPKGSAYQGACPRARLTTSARSNWWSILVRVRASSEASVKVFGQVSWRSRPRPGGAGHSKAGGLTVGLIGGTKTMEPGRVARFKIMLPGAVLHRLGRLRPSQALEPLITARSTDLAGRISNDRFKVRLEGRSGWSAQGQP